MRNRFVVAPMMVLLGLACSSGAQSIRMGTPHLSDVGAFAAAVRWVVQQEALPVRIDPRPMRPGTLSDGESLVFPAVDPELIRRRAQVLSESEIPQTDGLLAVSCIGTGGLRANPGGPIAGHCAALDKHRAILISLPWQHGKDVRTQAVEVLVVSNSGFDAYHLTASSRGSNGWRIIHTELVFDVRS